MLPNAVPKPKPAKRGPKERAPQGLRKNREPMKRTKLKNGAGSKRRGGHMFPKNVDEAFREWIRAQRCIIWGRRYESRAGGHVLSPPHECHTPVQCCHVKTRGAGGDDRKNVVPLCAMAHDEQHRIGIPAFEQCWGVNLKAEAERLDREYVKSGGGIPEHP